MSTTLESRDVAGGLDELIYLATPYSHHDPDVQQQRFVAACQVAGDLMNRGRLVFSPIAQSHPVACECGLPGTWEFWERYDRAILRACDRLVVVKMPGWEQSRGIAAEIRIMRELGKPVEFMEF